VISSDVVDRPAKRRNAGAGRVQVVLVQSEIADLNCQLNVTGKVGNRLGEAAEVTMNIADEGDHMRRPD
jgi:hypothetical protein